MAQMMRIVVSLAVLGTLAAGADRTCYDCEDCKYDFYSSYRESSCASCATIMYGGRGSSKVDRMCSEDFMESGCSMKDGMEICYCSTDYCNDQLGDLPDYVSGASSPMAVTLSLASAALFALMRCVLLE